MKTVPVLVWLMTLVCWITAFANAFGVAENFRVFGFLISFVSASILWSCIYYFNHQNVDAHVCAKRKSQGEKCKHEEVYQLSKQNLAQKIAKLTAGNYAVITTFNSDVQGLSTMTNKTEKYIVIWSWFFFAMATWLHQAYHARYYLHDPDDVPEAEHQKKECKKFTFVLNAALALLVSLLTGANGPMYYICVASIDMLKDDDFYDMFPSKVQAREPSDQDLLSVPFADDEHIPGGF